MSATALFIGAAALAAGSTAIPAWRRGDMAAVRNRALIFATVSGVWIATTVAFIGELP